MIGRHWNLVPGLLTLALIFGVPSFVSAQSSTSIPMIGITPRDWIAPAIQAVGLLVIGLVGMRQFHKFHTQRERISEKESMQKQFTEILDRLVAPDPVVRANAALRLAEFGKMAAPVEGSKEQGYSYFAAAAAQLATALHLETNSSIRASVRDALQMLANFAHSTQNDSFLGTLIQELADSNRTTRTAFIKALGEYAATLPVGGVGEQSILKRFAAVAQFGDRPEVTARILKAFMGLHEFERNRDIYAAVRSTLEPEARHRSDVARFSQVEVAATALRETRDALAYALRSIVPPANSPAELDEDPKIAERRPQGNTEQPAVSRRNLVGCFLAGAQLNRAYLRHADLRDAFLQGAMLVAADLQGALLTNAHMQETALPDAFLQWANLNNAFMEQANLSNAKLKGATLNDARLFEADMIGVSFQDTSLIGANFAGACLVGASFEGSCLLRINFQEANLIRANLRKAYLSESDLRKAYLTEAQLQEATLVSANLSGANLMQARLEGANLKNARLEHTQIFGAVLDGMVEGQRANADFDKAILNGLDLRNPLTGQVDTQARDWLIRYFPREARCLAIDPDPALAASGIEKTQELPPPIILSITETITATENPKILNPPEVAEPEKTIEPMVAFEPVKSVDSAKIVQPKAATQPELEDEPIHDTLILYPEKIVVPEPVAMEKIVPEPIRPEPILPEPMKTEPMKVVLKRDHDEKTSSPVEIGEQVPLPKGWRYSARVVVVTPQADPDAPLAESV